MWTLNCFLFIFSHSFPEAHLTNLKWYMDFLVSYVAIFFYAFIFLWAHFYKQHLMSFWQVITLKICIFFIFPFLFLHLNSYSSWEKHGFGTVLDWKMICEGSLWPPAVRQHYTNYSFSFPVMITCICFLPILETEIALHDDIHNNLVSSVPHGTVCYSKLTTK